MGNWSDCLIDARTLSFCPICSCVFHFILNWVSIYAPLHTICISPSCWKGKTLGEDKPLATSKLSSAFQICLILHCFTGFWITVISITRSLKEKIDGEIQIQNSHLYSDIQQKLVTTEQIKWRKWTKDNKVPSRVLRFYFLKHPHHLLHSVFLSLFQEQTLLLEFSRSQHSPPPSQHHYQTPFFNRMLQERKPRPENLQLLYHLKGCLSENVEWLETITRNTVNVIFFSHVYQINFYFSGC